MVNFARGWWGRAECAHTHAHIAMKVKRKEWSEARGSGKNRFGIYLSVVCVRREEGWVTSNWESRDIRRDWRVVFRNGFVNQMLPANGCFARCVAVAALPVLLEKGRFLFFGSEKLMQKISCSSWYAPLLKGVLYADFSDLKFDVGKLHFFKNNLINV